MRLIILYYEYIFKSLKFYTVWCSFLILVFFISSTLLSQTWDRIIPSFSTADSSLDMSNGVMVTKNIGWFADMYVPLEDGNFEARIYKTNDGGHYWALQYSARNNYGFGKFYCFDTMNCVISHGWGLLRTSDGGFNWEYKLIDSVWGYSTIYYMFNKNDGFAFLKYPRQTTNGGIIWQILDTTFTLGGMTDIYFPTKKKGWITGNINPRYTDSGFLIKTTDGGKSWHYPYDTTGPPPLELTSITFTDSLYGYFTGVNAGGGCIVYRTSNGGEDWGSAFGKVSSCGNIAFLDSSHGWITGANGQLGATTDGGITWNKMSFGTDQQFRRISPIQSEKLVYIFGKNNTLWRSDFTTGVQNENKETNSFTLYQNYPNPFNPSTVIRYQIPIINTKLYFDVKLSVYDLLGQERAILIQGKQTQGNYEVGFNARGLPSGIYIYQLDVDDKQTRRKMIVLK